MKALNGRTIGSIAAGLGLAVVIAATPLIAQPQGTRAERGNRGPGDAPPAFRHDAGMGRGPMAGGPAGPLAHGPGPVGMLGDQFIRFWDRPAIAERLELSENQIELLNQSYDQSKPIVEENSRAMREAGRTIAESLRHDGDPDINAVNEAIDAYTAAQNAVMKAAATHRATVVTLLLDEQLEQLHQIRRQQVQHGAENLRERIPQIRDMVRRIAADGVFSDEERARVEARLADAPEPMRERILQAIERAVARVAAGGEVGDLKEELSDAPDSPRPPRALPPLPPDPIRERVRDGSGPEPRPRARR